MSSEGHGTVFLIPVAMAGALLAGGAIVVYGGAKFVVWVGQKLDENYRNAVLSFSQAEAARIGLIFADPHDRSRELNAQIQAMLDAGEAQVGAIGNNQAYDTTQTRELIASANRRLDQAQANDAATRQRDAALITTERDNAVLTADRRKLRAQLEALRSHLSSSEVAAMESALLGDQTATTAALERLERVTAALDATQRQAMEQRIGTDIVLQEARSRLAAARALARETGAGGEQRVTLEHSAARNLDEATQYLTLNPTLARERAEAALRDARELMSMATTHLVVDDSARRQTAARLRGQLQALKGMLTETATAFNPRVALPLQDQIAARRQQVAELAGQVEELASGDATILPAQLEQRVDEMKDRVFALVRGQQQHAIGTTIHDTLSELGFAMQPMHHPGGYVTVAAARPADAVGGTRSVQFTINADGDVAYDFSGYVGNACLVEAEQVFIALRRHGIVIFDPIRAEGVLDQAAIQEPGYRPRLRLTKPNAKYHMLFKDILRQMGLGHIVEREHRDPVTGALKSTELDASRDGQGFRDTIAVVVGDQGWLHIHHNGQEAQPGDPLVQDLVARMKAEAARAAEEEEAPEMTWDQDQHGQAQQN